MIAHHDTATLLLDIVRVVGIAAAAAMLGEAAYLAVRLARRYFESPPGHMHEMWRGAAMLMVSVALITIAVFVTRTGRYRTDAPMSFLDVMGLISTVTGAYALAVLAKVDGHLRIRRRKYGTHEQ